MFEFRFLLFKKNLIKNWVLVFLVLMSLKTQAFLAEALKAKEQVEGVGVALESLSETIEEVESLLKIEKDFLAYEKELKEFQDTLEEYEKLGLDVKDFIEFKSHSPSSLKEQIDFLKDYIKRAKKILDSLSDILKSPQAITASEQIETNRTLRALLEDNQSRELRKLRREIAKEKILLDRRKKEQEFINKQYAYINRHSKKTGFAVFHPFTDKKKKENKNEIKPTKQKKFLGVF